MLVGMMIYGSSPAFADDLQLAVDGKYVDFSKFGQKPLLMENRTMVPLRAVEALGATLEYWDQQEKFALFTKDTLRCGIRVGKSSAVINGFEIPLETPPLLINDRVMVPLRLISEAFGKEVSWDATTRTVYLGKRSEQG